LRRTCAGWPSRSAAQSCRPSAQSTARRRRAQPGDHQAHQRWRDQFQVVGARLRNPLLHDTGEVGVDRIRGKRNVGVGRQLAGTDGLSQQLSDARRALLVRGLHVEGARIDVAGSLDPGFTAMEQDVEHRAGARRAGDVAQCRHRNRGQRTERISMATARGLLEHLFERQDRPVTHRPEQFLLAAEMPVNRTARDAGLGGNLVQRRARDPAPAKHAFGRVEQAVAGR
jgi:hypothetical protein